MFTVQFAHFLYICIKWQNKLKLSHEFNFPFAMWLWTNVITVTVFTFIIIFFTTTIIIIIIIHVLISRQHVLYSVCKQVVHSEVLVYFESSKKEVKHHDWYCFWFLCHTGNGRSGALWDTLFHEVCSVVILSIWANILSSFDMHTYYLHTMHNVRDGCCSNRALWKQSRSQLSGLDHLRMLGLYD